MKVNTNGVDKLNSEYVQRDLKKIKDAEKVSGNNADEDRVELSSKALDLKAMQDIARLAPDIRAEKVTAIKAQMDSGSYKISAEKLADKMMEEFAG